MKIGIFGGAFNPVHKGHLYLAKSCFDALSLDKIIFIPTYKPPHKNEIEFASPCDRVNMLKLALDNKCYEISLIEFDREEKSYTFDTLTELKKIYPDDSFYLIIGSDQFLNFNKWYRYKDILSLVTLCTFARQSGDRDKMLSFSSELGGDNAVILDEMPMMVSSSEVREKLRLGEDVSALIDGAVLRYIKDNNLYV